jgi:hypothetical protein
MPLIAAFKPKIFSQPTKQLSPIRGWPTGKAVTIAIATRCSALEKAEFSAQSGVDGNRCIRDARRIVVFDLLYGGSRAIGGREFFLRWYRPLAMAPFVLILLVIFRFFPHSHSRFLLGLVFAALAWAMAVAGYSLYRLFAG